MDLIHIWKSHDQRAPALPINPYSVAKNNNLIEGTPDFNCLGIQFDRIMLNISIKLIKVMKNLFLFTIYY